MLTTTIIGVALLLLKLVGGMVAALYLLSIVSYLLAPTISDEEFLDAVGFHWKTGLEIRKEIERRYCEGREFFHVRTSLYIRLHRLEERGWVESRPKIMAEEQLAITGGIVQREYRRTGKRKRLPADAKDNPIIVTA